MNSLFSKNKRAEEEGTPIFKIVSLILLVVFVVVLVFAIMYIPTLSGFIKDKFDYVKSIFGGNQNPNLGKQVIFSFDNKNYTCNMEFDSTNGKWCKIDFSKCLDKDKKPLGSNIYCYNIQDRKLGFFINNICESIKVLSIDELHALVGPYTATHQFKPGSLLYQKNNQNLWEPADPLWVDANKESIINYISESIYLVEIQNQVQNQFAGVCR